MITRWLWAIVALVVFMLFTGWPAFALLAWGEGTLVATGVDEAGGSASPILLWVRTIAWSGGIGIGSALLGWGPGRLLAARMRNGQGRLLLLLLLLPVLVPGYTVFYTLWQAWPVDSAFHEWLVSVDGLATARSMTLVVALLAWSWPLASLWVAPVAATWSSTRSDQLSLDAVPRLQRAGHLLRHDAPGLLAGALFTGVMVFSNTTCFDLAGIFTVANELRATVTLQSGLAIASPLVWPSLFMAIACGFFLLRRVHVAPRIEQEGRTRTSSVAWSWFGILWCVSLPIPVWALWMNTGPLDLGTYVTLYGGSLEQALLRSAIVGGLSIIPMLLLVRLFLDGSPLVRGIGVVLGVGWLVAGFIPGTILGLATEAAWNHTATASLVHGSGLSLLLALVSRSALVPVFLAAWLVHAEPRSQRDARLLEGGDGLFPALGAMKGRLVPALFACVGLTASLSLGEIVLVGLLSPPASSMPLATSLLNAMHYQRPEVVILTLLVLLGWGLLAVGCCGIGLLLQPARRGSIASMLLISILIVGCGDATTLPSDGAMPLPVSDTYARSGRSEGALMTPRAIAIDRSNGRSYVIDKTGRVQVFDSQGVFLHGWSMPSYDNGKPTGVSIGPRGNVWVADTHEFQVIAFDPEGNELLRFGEFGEQPGQFLYPTDVAFGPDGSIYVTEYGGNDRVQVFTREGQLLRVLGGHGSEPGEFDRPQALAVSPDGNRIYVADSCNHRIQVLDPEGRVLQVIGQPGREPGHLHYPYDLVLLADGSLLVCEFGSSRIQHLAPDGTSLGTWGLHGTGPVDLNAPWGIDVDGTSAWILDTGNNRIQLMDLP
ncbi:MAG: SMP-30/gluconolactonase/LRE family protein [Planctomycetota bacterium]|nr:SMP-30/gluconolactonase/LRE family protein [Planctomycetota bacterium]